MQATPTRMCRKPQQDKRNAWHSEFSLWLRDSARHAAALDANAAAAAATASSMSAEEYCGSRELQCVAKQEEPFRASCRQKEKKWGIKQEKMLCAYAEAEGKGELRILDGELV